MRGISNCHFHVWFYVQVADPKPLQLNTKYYVKTIVPHFCATLWHIFFCATLYIVNVPHFWVNCHTFICSMFYCYINHAMKLNQSNFSFLAKAKTPPHESTRSFPNLGDLVQLGPRTVTSPTTFTQPSFGQIDLIKGYYVPFSIHCIFSLTLMT